MLWRHVAKWRCTSWYWTKHEKNIYLNEHCAPQNSLTEQFDSNGTTSELCSGYAGCDLVGILVGLTKTIVFFILYKQLPGYYRKVGHDHLFRNNSNSLFTEHLNAWRCVNWGDDSAINKHATRANLMPLILLFNIHSLLNMFRPLIRPSSGVCD